ncbi:MAG: hypothetical protein EXQ52_00190 [Bryobacterales bacterium]|nr:hypothetical protein [Bryobacterales bacterium]
MKSALLMFFLLAHHGDAGRWDDKVTVLKGTVVELQFTNPHTMIVFDVNDSGKDVRWQAELDGTSPLMRELHWNKTTLKPGDKITITGRRVKSGSPYLSMNERAIIVMSGTGKELFRTDDKGELVAPQP